MIQPGLQPAIDLSTTARLDAHVAVLINYLSPHHLVQMEQFAKRVRKLSVLISTQMEPNRAWQAQWGDLDVTVQKNWMLTRKWRHTDGFAEDNYIHIPWDTTRQLKRLKPDVILSYEMGMRSVFSSWYRARHPESVLVVVANVSMQTEKSRGVLRPRLRKYLFNRIDLATYNGPSCKQYLMAQGIADEQLLYLPYCHDFQKVYSGKLQPYQLPAKRLFFCGGLTERKGVVPFCLRLAAWCEHHPEREIEFVLAGDGPLRLVLETLRVPPNLKLNLIGSIDPEQIRDQYRLADLTVYPTLADEWGLVINESLASGTPLISSIHAQSTEELMKHGQNGWLFDSLSDEDMSRVIDEALTASPDKLTEMSRLARDSVQHISAEANGDCFQAVIERALKIRSNAMSQPQRNGK